MKTGIRRVNNSLVISLRTQGENESELAARAK